MFCHYCGAKLVKSARFCSKCGTPVPDEIQDEMKLDQQGSAPADSSPKAEPVKENTPAPVSAQPVFTPAPKMESRPSFETPVIVSREPPKAITEEAQRPEQKIEPLSKPEEKDPVREEPEQAEEFGKPERWDHLNKPEPIRSFEEEKKPESATYSALIPEKIVLPITVTEKQIREMDTVTLRSDSLIEPLYLKLTSSMKDGMRLKLTNAKLYPGENGAERVLVVALSVKEEEKPKLPPVEHIVDLRVTSAQIQEGKSVALKDSELENPLVLNLKPTMKDGMCLKLPNVKLNPAPNGAKRLLVARIVVTDGKGTSFYNPPASEKKAEPVRQTPAARPYTSVQSSTQPAQRAVQTTTASHVQQQVRQTEPARKTVSFAPVSSNCTFQLCEGRNLRTGFHFGGADEIGTAEIAPSAVTIYRKSKMTGAAFGIVGSMIEGKGKAFASVRPQDIASVEKTMKNGKLIDYRIHLKDRRLLKIAFQSMRLTEVLNALDLFLSQT